MSNFSTYNQIVKAFTDIATAHYQVNSFGVGDTWDMATSGTTNYPLVWALPTDGSLTGKIYNSNWTLIFMDIHHADQNDVDEITSDMELVALDFIAQLQKPDYDFNFKPDSISFKRFNEEYNDLVAGVAIDITIEVPYTFDRCAIPSSLINVQSGTSVCAPVSIYDIDGTFLQFVASGGRYDITTSGGSNVTAMEGITAHAGGGQTLATALTETYNFVDTVASSGDSVKAPTALSTSSFATFCYIQNNGANDMSVYPQAGEKFTGYAINAALTVAPGGMITLVCATTGTFRYY